METKHTQGEWHAVNYSGYWSIQKEPYYTDKDNLLDAADVGEDIAEANAKLIAAAPDLLKALIYVCSWLEVDSNNKMYDAKELKPYNQAKAAIKKATL